MGKGKNWVDYKEIKERISIEMVLERYGIELKKGGQNLVGCCPIHKGTNPRQFSVSPEKNIWNCFGNCQTGGNVMDLVALMEFGSKDPESIRKAALVLKGWFPGSSELGGNEPPPERGKLVREGKADKIEAPAEKKVNEPLKFALRNLDPEHPFFAERGIQPETVEYFGLGYCTKGMMAGRIAIPIHDHLGQLVAYCGRAVTPEQEAEAKYKLPGNFYKSEVVYNLHRQQKSETPLIIVESYISVWKAHQSGFPHVVALMGSSLSEKQEELILDFSGPSGKAVLMFDADEDGAKCTQDCLFRLGQRIYAQWVDISPYAKKPHQLTPEQLKELLSRSLS